MKVQREDIWLKDDWSCMYDTRGEALLCRRFLPWLVTGMLVLGAFGAIMGAIIGAVVKVTGEQVLEKIVNEI